MTWKILENKFCLNFFEYFLSSQDFGLSQNWKICTCQSDVIADQPIDQASVPEKSQFPRVSTFRLFVKPGQGAQKGS